MKPRILQVLDIGLKPYAEAFQIQEERVLLRQQDKVPDTLILVEHPPVYTLGRNASAEDVTATDAEREARHIELVRTSRGGKVTFHGPGQLVGYPILMLGSQAREAVRYVGMLENLLIRVLGDFGLQATGDARNRGVWIGDEKIAALGVRITGGVSMHGFALNVRVDVSYYRGIVPCGLVNKGITSMDRFLPMITLEEVKPVLVRRFREGFSYGA